MFELKPCPFCGGKVSLVLCDDEGNLHDEAYREHPYSGVGFMLHHAHEENPECPIASYECDGGILGGVHIYDTEEQAAEAWNKRAEVVHGRWVTHYRSGTPVAEGYVSTCCDMWNNRKSDYCPSCGAKMDGGDSDACVGSNDFCSYGERKDGES